MARTVTGLFYGAVASEDVVEFFEHQVGEDIQILYGHEPQLIGYWVVRNLIDASGASLDDLRALPDTEEAKTMWLAFVDRWAGSDHPTPTSPRLYIATRRE